LNRILFLSFALFAATLSAWASPSGDSFVLVLDAGHGGHDPGAAGKHAREKDVNLSVTKLTGEYIAQEHPDVKIIYTRKNDVFIGLNKRAQIANKAKANLFISIHSNSVKSASTYGAAVYILGLHRTQDNLEVAKRENSVILLEDNYKETYQNFDPNSSESYIIFELMQNRYLKQSWQLAEIIQKKLVSTAKRKDMGVRQAGFCVLRETSMPSILIELEFISNSEGEKFLSSRQGQEKLARAIADGFSAYKKEHDANKKQVEADRNKPKPTKETPKAPSQGLVYKVQIMSFDKKMPVNAGCFKGYAVDYYVENNTYKYTYGESSDWNEINRIRKSLQKDFKDAFVVKFQDGVRISN
jgi:N-acetylmuramoyl-L-alanine amidase